MTSEKKIRVLNKNGRFMNDIPLHKAEFSVKRGKCTWIDGNTIQVLYHGKDEKRFKHEVWERDNYTCQYCGEEMYAGHPELTVDHVDPKHLGGSILPSNMLCSCKKCNAQKQYRDYKQYFLHLYAGLYFMVLWWKCKKF